MAEDIYVFMARLTAGSYYSYYSYYSYFSSKKPI